MIREHDLWYMSSELTEILFEVLPHTVVISTKTLKLAENTICYNCKLNSLRYDFFEVLLHTVVIKPQNGQISWEHDLWYLRSEFTEIWDLLNVLPHTVVISRKTVKWAENTICDTCALHSNRYYIFEILDHTNVINRKTGKWAEDTICVYLWTELTEIWDFSSFNSHCNKP